MRAHTPSPPRTRSLSPPDASTATFTGRTPTATTTGRRATAPRGGRRLPPAFKRRMERAFRAPLNEIRVHEGPEPARIGAIAFARGSDLHFSPGRFDLSTPQGLSIVAHELVHTRQQRMLKRPQPSLDLAMALIVDDPALESVADASGARALRGEFVEPVVEGLASRSFAADGATAVQRLPRGKNPSDDEDFEVDSDSPSDVSSVDAPEAPPISRSEAKEMEELSGNIKSSRSTRQTKFIPSDSSDESDDISATSPSPSSSGESSAVSPIKSRNLIFSSTPLASNPVRASGSPIPIASTTPSSSTPDRALQSTLFSPTLSSLQQRALS